MNYKTVVSIESRNPSYIGELGFRIQVSQNHFSDENLPKEIRIVLRNCLDDIENIYLKEIAKANPNRQKEIDNNRKLLDIFDEIIFSEEIPNEYCSEWCCEHLSWFIVTTKIGRIKIGWRKRVIEICWEDSRNIKTAEELFPNEDVTKFNKSIHAWSIEKAKEYIDKIIKDKGEKND